MNKVLLSSAGNYIQYPVISHNGKEYETHVELNHFALQQKLTQHCKSTILQFFKKGKDVCRGGGCVFVLGVCVGKDMCV